MNTTYKSGVSLLYQVIPDEFQDRAIQRGENISRDKWGIGDDTNYIKQLVKDRLLDCSIMDVYTFMAQLLRDEVSSRTIEYYSGISAFYDVHTRAEYQPLSHAHFAYARQHGDDWLSVLNLAMDLLSQTGKVPSVSQVDFILMRRGGIMQEIPENPPAIESIPMRDEQTVESDYISSVISVPLKAAITALETLQRILAGLGRANQAEKLGEIVKELQDNIDSVI